MEPELAFDGAERPLVIHASSQRDGTTYALDLSARRMIQERFGAMSKPSARLFVSHETRDTFEEVAGPMRKQIIVLLTGLAEERLQNLGRVEFRESPTENLLYEWTPDPR